MRRFPILWLLILGCTGCLLGCSEPASDSAYRYTFSERNDTPQALAATLFEALRTGDQELWTRYCATEDELKAHEARRSDEQIRSMAEKIRENHSGLRNELRHEHGVHGADRIRFLRTVAPGYAVEDSTQMRTAVEYTYQGHYIGQILFREMIRTDRGWVLADVSRYYDDVNRLMPIGGRR